MNARLIMGKHFGAFGPLCVVSFAFLTPAHAQNQCSPAAPLACRPSPGLTAADAGTVATAGAYCTSVGGSTLYEEITSISVTQVQDSMYGLAVSRCCTQRELQRLP